MDRAAMERIVTEKRAAVAARALFPADYKDDTNCRAESGREGKICTVCLDQRMEWLAKVADVREAIMAAMNSTGISP